MLGRARFAFAAVVLSAACIPYDIAAAQDTIPADPPAGAACADAAGCTSPVSGLTWRPARGGAIPDNAWPAGFEPAAGGRRDLYICRAWLISSRLRRPAARWGKIGRGYAGCSVVSWGFELIVNRHGYEVLTTPLPEPTASQGALVWRATEANRLPGNPVGLEGEGTCRAEHRGGVHPGGFIDHGGCTITYQGRLVTKRTHEVLARPVQLAAAPPPATAAPVPERVIEVPLGHAVMIGVTGERQALSFAISKRMAVMIDAAPAGLGPEPGVAMGAQYARWGNDGRGAHFATAVLEPGTHRFDLLVFGGMPGERNIRVIVAPLIGTGGGSLMSDFVDAPGGSREGYVGMVALDSQRVSVDVRAPPELAEALTTVTLIAAGGRELRTVPASQVLETMALGSHPTSLFLVRVGRSAGAPPGPFMVAARVTSAPQAAPPPVATAVPPAPAAAPVAATPAPRPAGPASADIAIGETASLRFDPSRAERHGRGLTQYYGLACERGARLQIDVTSDWNNYALLLDRRQETVTSADDISGTNARLFHECADDGRYYVAILGRPPVAGPFTLRVGRAEERATIAPGQSRTGVLRSAGRFSTAAVAYYGFACDNMQSVSFRTSGGELLMLFDPAGNKVRDGAGTMRVSCGRAGMWVIGAVVDPDRGAVTIAMDP